MENLARIARKSATLYRELRRDVVRLAAEERRKKKDKNGSELVKKYKAAVHRLEEAARLVAKSDGDGHQELDDAAKNVYLAANECVKAGSGLPRMDPRMESYLCSAIDYLHFLSQANAQAA
jgi:hypothetical protein